MKPRQVEMKKPGGNRHVAQMGKCMAKEMGMEGELVTLIAVNVPSRTVSNTRLFLHLTGRIAAWLLTTLPVFCGKYRVRLTYRTNHVWQLK